ncbi:MAG: hypothetical protein HKN87_19785 [Saprospiraceae bacterium]|nr:hypothetical protein [Saprospiraceae bacterium]
MWGISLELHYLIFTERKDYNHFLDKITKTELMAHLQEITCLAARYRYMLTILAIPVALQCLGQSDPLAEVQGRLNDEVAQLNLELQQLKDHIENQTAQR